MKVKQAEKLIIQRYLCAILAVACFLPTIVLGQPGTFDASFRPDVTNPGFRPVWTTASYPEGAILIGGAHGYINEHRSNMFSKLNQDGTPDESFLPEFGFRDGEGNGAGNLGSIVVQPDGKIIVGNQITSFDRVPVNHVARLNVDGTLDTSFDTGTGPVTVPRNHVIFSLSLQADGKLIVGGVFTEWDGHERNSLVRLMPDGSVDEGFAPVLQVDPEPGSVIKIHKVMVLPDGKIWAAGRGFARVNEREVATFFLLNPDGSLDESFDAGGGADGTVINAGLMPDGRVVVVGEFTMIAGESRARLARLHPDGSLDLDFVGPEFKLEDGSGFPPDVQGLWVQDDGRMVIAGAFTSVDGYSRNHIVRLMPDGEVDTSFDPGTGFGLLSEFAIERLGGAFLRNVIQESSGDYIVVGAFESVDGHPQTGVARLFGDANAPSAPFRSVAGYSREIAEATDEARIWPVGKKIIWIEML